MMTTKKLIKVLCKICVHHTCNSECPLWDEHSKVCLKEMTRDAIDIAENHKKNNNWRHTNEKNTM